MNKVIGHYQAVCPYCGARALIQEKDNGRLKMRDGCRHFDRIYKEGFKIMVRFSILQDVEAIKEVGNG